MALGFAWSTEVSPSRKRRSNWRGSCPCSWMESPTRLSSTSAACRLRAISSDPRGSRPSSRRGRLTGSRRGRRTWRSPSPRAPASERRRGRAPPPVAGAGGRRSRRRRSCRSRAPRHCGPEARPSSARRREPRRPRRGAVVGGGRAPGAGDRSQDHGHHEPTEDGEEQDGGPVAAELRPHPETGSRLHVMSVAPVVRGANGVDTPLAVVVATPPDWWRPTPWGRHPGVLRLPRRREGVSMCMEPPGTCKVRQAQR